jgi:HAD superfamily phosphoserine phosphatase-like hydrolase
MVEVVTSAEIVARISKARPTDGQRSLLAFDADGTLWRGDVGCDVFAGTIERKAFKKEAHAVLAEDARGLALDPEGPSEAIAARLLDAFHQGRWDDGPAAIGMALAFAGYTDDEALALADEVLASAKLPARVHPGVREVIAWARAHDVDVVVVSASPSPVVRAAVRTLEIPPASVIAMDLETDGDGRFVPRLSANVYGEGKVTALEAHLRGAAIVGAFGDSFGDRFLLRKARVPVAVGPSPKLLAEASTINGMVVLPFPAESA